MTTTILGIDPGANGGFAWKLGGALLATERMPETEGDILDILRDIERPAVAYIEQLPTFVRMIPSSTTMKMGQNAGFIRGCLMALGYRIIEVRPQQWQKTLGFGTRGEMTDTEWKNKLKARAQQLYPEVKVTLATSDALLLLEYGRIHNGGVK